MALVAPARVLLSAPLAGLVLTELASKEALAVAAVVVETRGSQAPEAVTATPTTLNPPVTPEVPALASRPQVAEIMKKLLTAVVLGAAVSVATQALAPEFIAGVAPALLSRHAATSVKLI